MTKAILLVIIVLIGLAIAGYFFMNQSTNLSLEVSPSTSPSASVSTSPSNIPLPTFVPITKDRYTAVIKTTRGEITLDLFAKEAPLTVSNFITLAQSGFYDGTKFHRVIDDFMIQGGDPLSRTDDPRVGSGGPGYRFADEPNGLKVDVGVIAMANSGPNTNGSQFFIVSTRPQPHLNGIHTVFGKVTKGMNVVLAVQQGDVVTSITIQ